MLFSIFNKESLCGEIVHKFHFIVYTSSVVLTVALCSIRLENVGNAKYSICTPKFCTYYFKIFVWKGGLACMQMSLSYFNREWWRIAGDAEASFTKEEMQQGKHQEYEKKLHEQLLNTYNHSSTSRDR